MAKKRKKRSRRVGATGLGKTGTLIKLAALAGGFFAGNMINEQIDKILPKTTPTGSTTPVPNEMVGIIGEVGIGGALLLFSKKARKAKVVADVAGGLLAGAGVRRLAKIMGMMTGYQSVPVLGRKHRVTNGYQSVPVIGAKPAQLQGRPAQLQGFRVNGYTPTGSGAVMSGCGSGITGSSGSGYMQ
jgi:hypothetical protein